ncbi:PREDICTED: XK-related protein 4-like [Priapulus caudatus]|uniref:XK-related protein n=1 Tax=Priapulus caudatus TaxID=37621 RepID=A0ABM1EF58_PRICU|nr:PREDICTED: XK-related protein 4-like [Priapulus caudatus]
MAGGKVKLKSAPDAHDARSFTDRAPLKLEVDWWWLAAILVSIGSYVFDVATDLVVAALLYQKEQYNWFALTLAFVVGASLVMSAFTVRWYLLDAKQTDKPIPPWKWAARIVLIILQMGPILRYIDTFYYGLKVIRKSEPQQKRYYYHLMMYEDVDSNMLRLIEAFIESAPQLVLQLYIIAVETAEKSSEINLTYIIIIQLVSCCFSLVNLSWAIAAYHRSLRISLRDKENMSLFATVLYFFWQLFVIGVRVLAMAVFASHFPHLLFAVAAAHWALMFCWIWLQQTTFCGEQGGWDERLFGAVAAWVHLFCFLNVTEGRTRSRYFMYYCIVYVENAMMVLVWFFTVGDNADWYRWHCVCFVLAGFWLGIGFMLVYYWFFHPNQSQIEGMCCIKREGQAVTASVTPAASRHSSVTSRPSQVSATSPAHGVPAAAYSTPYDEVDAVEMKPIIATA